MRLRLKTRVVLWGGGGIFTEKDPLGPVELEAAEERWKTGVKKV